MRSSSRSSSLSRETHDGRDPVTKSRRRRVAVLTTAASLDVEQPREPDSQQVLSHNENGKSPDGKTTTRCLHQTTQTQGINCSPLAMNIGYIVHCTSILQKIRSTFKGNNMRSSANYKSNASLQ